MGAISIVKEIAMKRLLSTAALCLVAGTFALSTPALAQSHRDRDRYDHHDRGERHDRYDRRGDRDRNDWNDNRGYRDRSYDSRRYSDRGHHNGWRDRSDWRRGGYVSYNDWGRGYRVDYRRHHLRQPPYGYEWRRVDDNYVLAAIATGLIASIIINGG